MSSSFLPSGFGKSEKPFFQNLQKEVGRVFDEFRDLTPWNEDSFFAKENGQLVPKLDLSETENEVQISTELPGVKMDDIDISVTSNVVSIKGEKSAESKQEKKDYHRVERSYGSFARSVALGFDIDPKEVKADFADGVLTIKIEKPAEIAGKTQKIKITKSV